MVRRRVAAIIAMIALLAGCAGASPAWSPSTAPTVASVAPTATVLPSPTPDVISRFKAKTGLFGSGVATIEATVTVGSMTMAMTGQTRFSGDDSENTMTTVIGGTRSVEQTIVVAGQRFTREGEGPWLEAPAESGNDDVGLQIEDLLEGGFVDGGSEVRGGKEVHRLVPSRSGFDPAGLLSSFRGAKDIEADMAMFVVEDGTPVAMTFEFTWDQPQGDATVEAEMTMEMAFTNLGGPIMVKRPEHVWQRFSSTRYGFAFAYPDEWSYVSNGSWEEFDAPWAAFLLIQAVGAPGTSLNVQAKSELAALKKEFNTKSGTNEATKLDGVPARVLTVSGWSDSVGAKVNVFEVVALNSFHTWYVAWISEVGRETLDRQLFDQILSTFEFELIRMQ